jgi:hypothetical protein
MHEAATEPHRRGDARPRSRALRRSRIVWRASLVVGLLCIARVARAQLPPSPLPLSNTEDARTLPRGTVLLRGMNVWTRIDAVYDAAADSVHHLHPLGDAFSASQLGTRQFPGLAAAENALRRLTGDPSLSLNLGQTFATADTRIVTTPLSLAYGVTNRLTIGAMVPVVQTHTTVFVELNPRRLGANAAVNVGPNAARLGNTDAVTAFGNLTSDLGNAKSPLQTFVDNCRNSGGCSSDAVRQANWALNNDTLFLKAVAVLYGTDAQASAFSPLGAAQQKVLDQLKALQDTVQLLLGSGYAFRSPLGANGMAALFQLQQLVTANPGIAFDSLGSPDRLGIGDVEISALFKLVDGFSDTTGGVRLRGTLRGVLRLGTGLPPSGTVPYEVGTGTGQTSADGGGILDVRLGRRLMTTLAAQYTTYFTSASVARLPNSDYALFPLDVPVGGTWREGDALQLEAAPRIQLTDYFTFHGAYTFRHQAASRYTSPESVAPPLFSATTEQRAGLGFAYSSLARYARGKSSVPFELFFTHLETITASGGLTPKYHRDQIEFRIYYRLLRGGR